MEKIKRKKLIIISVYLSLFFFVVIVALAFLAPKESCQDGRKNQNEQGIDCGGICQTECDKIEAQPLIAETFGAVHAGVQGKYDFYVRVVNPNAAFGSRKFDYEIKFKNAEGAILAERFASSFILPGEHKYVIESNIESTEKPVSYDFSIKDSDWVEFNDYYKKPNIQIVNKAYEEISGGDFSEAKGLLKNESEFDFDTLKIAVILKDEANGILALNSTQMKTIRSGESRDFRVFWPSSFPGVVGNMEVQVEVNVFDADAFLKTYYNTGKFQEY